MKCWVCSDIDLIWGGDDDALNEDGKLETVSNLSCPECDAQVFVHHGPRGYLPEWVEKLDLNDIDCY